MRVSLRSLKLLTFSTAALLAAACGTAEPPAATEEEPPGAAGPGAPAPRPVSDESFESTPARLERGRYLAEGILACMTCHSERDWSEPGAPVIEETKGAGAVYWADEAEGYVMPAPNLTPDPETGAGRWPDDALARAIREGVGHDGRALNPAMTYGSFRDLTDEDVRSVVVYLRSLPPRPANHPPRQVSEERQAGYTARLLPPLTEPVTRDDLDDPLERGRYLITVADCMGCHTSWYGETNPGLFAGGNPVRRWGPRAQGPRFSTNITPAPSGIPYYDAALFREVLRTGRVRARALHGTMPWIAYRHLTDDDLDAIFLALQNVRPADHYVDNTEPEATPCPRCGQTHGGGELNRPLAPKTDVELPPELLARYAGTYRFENGMVIEIAFEDGRLTGPMTGDLYPESETTFVTRLWGAPLTFVLEDDGAVSGVVSHDLVDWHGTREP